MFQSRSRSVSISFSKNYHSCQVGLEKTSCKSLRALTTEIQGHGVLNGFLPFGHASKFPCLRGSKGFFTRFSCHLRKRSNADFILLKLRTEVRAPRSSFLLALIDDRAAAQLAGRSEGHIGRQAEGLVFLFGDDQDALHQHGRVVLFLEINGVFTRLGGHDA